MDNIKNIKSELPETEDSVINHINKSITDNKNEYEIELKKDVSEKTDNINTSEEKKDKETKEYIKEEKNKRTEKKQEDKEEKHNKISNNNRDKQNNEKFEKISYRNKNQKEIPQKKRIELKSRLNNKKVEKMDKKKTIKKNNKKTKHVWIWVIIASLIIVLAVFLITNVSKNKNSLVKDLEIAATVNGEPIYVKDIEYQYNRLNPILQQTYTKEAILNQTIDELLLIQEAKAREIKISKDDIKNELIDFKKQNGLSDNEFENLLKTQNLTISQLEELVERRLLIKELLNMTIFNNINITDEAIKEYYEQNKENIKQPERVTVQHILILSNNTDAQNKIESIRKELTDTNFCELAKKYSEDPGSKDSCGVYSFGKGEMVQEFEDASFNLNINETTIVKTVYGYHLIKKLDYTPEKIIELSEVKEEIRNILRDEAAQKNFDKLLIELRSKAKIINYMYKDNQEEKAQSKEETNLDDFAKCLTEKGAKMYGAYWCPHCNNQKEMFGDSVKYITYVECAVEGQPQVQTPECIAERIAGYPTWIINGERYPGEQTLQTLSKLTGCKL
ncbi:MAG: hypothetical protein KatS3mg002_0115 [Candidatus Woesearchaeota archaeon]|nr:MAG: hypothetical protein KatS3mg002_0115 [Candidatus Woesearchaeota archaeon]